MGRWIVRCFRAVRLLAIVAIIGGATVVVSALGAGLVVSWWGRLLFAGLFTLGLPVAAGLWLRHVVSRRIGGLQLGRWWVPACNVVLLVVLALGFSDATGRALRRRGDWFLGQRGDRVAQLCREAIVRAGRWMERFDLPPEVPRAAREALAGALVPPPPDVSQPDAPKPKARWFHPTGTRAGRRMMPPNASCRFGAHRSGRRPVECELGHCGIDLAAPVGTPVYAVADGVVLSAVRDERRGGRAGRYVKLGHDGVAKTYYVHLDEIRAGLRAGSVVKGGEQIGTIGLTGVKRSAPHLHFGLAISWRNGRYRYVDPEPLLWFWRLPEPRADGRPLLARSLMSAGP